jgi:5-methyltetrahydropteroyltriglutamate--homocysteine methyltransferase
VWKNDISASLEATKKAIAALGEDRVIVSTSSSLLHTPVTLKNEDRLTEQQADWLSFALEKVAEVATLAHAASGSTDEKYTAALEANKKSIAARREFETSSDAAVRDRVAAIKDDDYKRKSPFPTRKEAQQKKLKMPRFPTTTSDLSPFVFFPFSLFCLARPEN